MAIKDFQELRERLKSRQQGYVVAIAAAEDPEIIRLVRELREQKLAQAILVGDRTRLAALSAGAGLCPAPELVQAGEEAEAARIAVTLVKEGRADALMKGLVNSSVFLRAVLDPEQGIRSAPLLSHLAAFEIPGQNRLHFHTDGGLCLHPDLEQKRAIVENAVTALHRLGYACPKVAALAANERADPKMPATVDAAALQQLNEQGLLPGCILEGPIAMDVAWSREAAAHKGIASRISGSTDLFLAPDIEAGNLVGKTLLYAAQAKMAGIVLGAARPVVLVSRADNAEAKLNSLALACVCQ